MLHLTAHLLSVVLFTSYSGALVSSIASSHPALPFRTFEEFLNNGHYRLGVVANSSIISNMRVKYIGTFVFYGNYTELFDSYVSVVTCLRRSLGFAVTLLTTGPQQIKQTPWPL
jgi:hypothetical protein